MLEMCSMLCYIQVATLTHGVFLLIPLVLLLVFHMVRQQGIHELVSEPLHLLWPHNHSRLGLARDHTSATKFVAVIFCVKLACSAVLWNNLESWSLLQEACHAAHRNATPGIFVNKTCMHRYFDEGSQDFILEMPQLKHMYEREDGACFHHCREPSCGCSPEVNRNLAGLQLFKLQLYSWQPCQECKLRCCQCLHCQLSPSLPSWLKPGCSDGAFISDVPRELYCKTPTDCTGYKSRPYYDRQTWYSENTMLAELARCVLTHEADPLELQAWWSVTLALQLLPSLALGAWLLLSLGLPMLLQEEALSMLGRATSDATLIQEVDDKARTIRKEISRKRLMPSMKDKAMLYMEFGFFLLDYFSDYNCLVRMILEQQYGMAVAQAVIIVMPVALDCYRGKIQVVEVVGGFMKARNAGFPTNAYILALRSEKGVEAPLSFCLQYYTLLRATSFGTVWSLCLSLLLSVMSMSKHAYNSFELKMFDVVTDDGPALPEAPSGQETQAAVSGFRRLHSPDTPGPQPISPSEIGFAWINPAIGPPPATWPSSKRCFSSYNMGFPRIRGTFVRGPVKRV